MIAYAAGISSRTAWLLVIGALALAVVAVAGLLATGWNVVAGAYLTAWLFWIGPPAGSLVLIMIHRVAGGDWGDSLAPALEPAARAMPLAAVLFVPVLLGSGWIYPWANGAETDLPPSVAALYLNMPSFAIRAVLILLFWSGLSVFFAWRGQGTAFAGAVGLVVYAATISFAAVDWAMAAAPHFSSTVFAASVAIGQVLSALAFAAVWSARRESPSATKDHGGLLLSVLLGFVYLQFMQYLVIWAGGLPEKAGWYVLRASDGWGIAFIACLLLGAVLPFLMLLSTRQRRDGCWVAGAGALVLIGLVIFWRWQMADVGNGRFGGFVDGAAVSGLGLLFIAWMRWQCRDAGAERVRR